MLRVIDQIVKLRQTLLPEAKVSVQGMIILLHGKSIVHSPCLLCTLGPFKTKRLKPELVAFAIICLVCETDDNFSPLVLVSTEQVNILLFLQNECAAKYR